MMADSWFGRVWQAALGARQVVGEDFIVRRLEGPQGVREERRQIAKDEEYIIITVRSSRIVNSRKWTGKFYGAVNARSHYLHGDRGEIEFQTVISPKFMKELDSEHLDRVITINKPILGPVPFLGGLSLELGLFSVKGSDLAGPYIDVLTSIAETAGVSFVTQAMPLIDPFRKGLDLLFGNADQADLEIGLDESWNNVETGTWLVVRAPKGTPGLEALQVDPNDFGLVDRAGHAYRDRPYMVFAIEGVKRRDDWMTIPDLKRGWDQIGIAARELRLNDAERLLEQFVQTAKWSPDLVPDDAKRLAEKARAKLPNLQKEEAIAGERVEAHPLGDLAALDLYAR